MNTIARRSFLVGAVAAPMVVAPRINRVWAATMPWLYNPVDYGAAWNGAADDRAYIQASWDDCKNHGGTVVYPPGVGCFTPGLDATGSRGMKMIGAGSDGQKGTILRAIGGATNVPLIDATNTADLRIQDLILTATSVPQAGCGILFGHAGTWTLDNIFVDGNYIFGALAIVKSASANDTRACKFYNNLNAAGVQTLAISKANGIGVVSQFAAADLASAPSIASDLSFFGCEVHDFSNNSQSNGPILLDGVRSFRYFGGNVSAQKGANSNGYGGQYVLALDSSFFGFYNSGFYADDGPNPNYLMSVPSGHACSLFDFLDCDPHVATAYFH